MRAKMWTLVSTVTIMVATYQRYSTSEGAMIEFYLELTKRSWPEQLTACKELGYDGLAVLRTPDEYAQALRLMTNKTGVAHVGLHRDPDTGTVRWLDGSLVEVDSPLPWGHRSFKHQHKIAGQLRLVRGIEEFTMTFGIYPRHAICENYTQKPVVALGTTRNKLEPVAITSNILQETASMSYFQCTLLCANNYRCRVAAFNFDLLSCTLIGPGETGYKVNSRVITFVRNGYDSAMWVRYLV